MTSDHQDGDGVPLPKGPLEEPGGEVAAAGEPRWRTLLAHRGPLAADAYGVLAAQEKAGDGRGPDRIAGAGPAAWARVICSIAVHYRGSDPDGASSMLLGVELVGGELADTRFRIRRRVRADDPADLGAPLAYSVEVLVGDDDDQDLEPAAAALSKSRQWVLAALRAGGTCRRSTAGDRLAQAGHPLKPRTIQLALGELEAAGLAAGSEEGNGRARYRSPTTTNPDADSAGDDQGGDGGERAWHELPGNVPDRGLAEPAHGESSRAQRITTRTRRPVCDVVRGST